MPRIDQNRPMPMPKGTAGDVVERERSYYDGGDFTCGSAARARSPDRAVDRGVRNSFPELFELFEARDKNVLDYGCGGGYVSLRLAESGASSVTAIDLSVGELDVARERAEAEGMGAGTVSRSWHAMPVPTPFPAASFDLIAGAAILHHLDLESALLEVKRLLRPDGQAVFVEPLRDNPILRLGRRASPGARTTDEHPLTPDDWALCADLQRLQPLRA